MGYLVHPQGKLYGEILEHLISDTALAMLDNAIAIDHRIQDLFVKYINTSFSQRSKISSFSRMWDLRGRGLLLIHGHKINAL